MSGDLKWTGTRCEFIFGSNSLDPLPLLVRWFPGETGDITMIVVGATALEFVAGSFTPYAIDEAADRRLTD